MSPPYMKDVFKPADQPNTTTRASLLKLNQLLQRPNHGQNNISCLTPIIWNNLPNSSGKQPIILTLKSSELRSIFFTEWEMR